MSNYLRTKPSTWSGRKSDRQLYLHEKVDFIDLEQEKLNSENKKVALLGYACGEGIKRNQGRIGSFNGPDAIRRQLAKMPNHLNPEVRFLDAGNVQCLYDDMKAAQDSLSEKVTHFLENAAFPILLGGGHDMAYAHYNGIKTSLPKNNSIGIINFDAHFDLRDNTNGSNSGTPFYQIAKDCEQDGTAFEYLCLGIRKDANDKALFQTANDLGVTFIESIKFSMHEALHIVQVLLDFIRKVDHIYVTIDLDGFSSAYAPGVSAPSPMGFTPKIVIESLELILKSKKLISLDVAEMNPKYDVDDRTAKLAASLVHYVMHQTV